MGQRSVFHKKGKILSGGRDPIKVEGFPAVVKYYVRYLKKWGFFMKIYERYCIAASNNRLHLGQGSFWGKQTPQKAPSVFPRAPARI